MVIAVAHNARRPLWIMALLTIVILWLGTTVVEVLSGGVFAVLNWLIGRSREIDSIAELRWFDFALSYLVCAVSSAIMQIAAVMVCRWVNMIWVLAGIISLQSILIVWPVLGFVPLLFIPWVVAILLARFGWAEAMLIWELSRAGNLVASDRRNSQ